MEPVGICTVKGPDDFDWTAPGIVWKDTEYNKEDRNTRHIVDVNRFDFGLSYPKIAEVKCGKDLSFSWLGITITIGELSGSVSLGVTGALRTEKSFYHEDGSSQGETSFGIVNPVITGQLKASFGLAAADEDSGYVLLGVLGSTDISITGGGRVEYPYNGNWDEIMVVGYLSPVNYAFSIDVVLGPIVYPYSHFGVLWDIHKTTDKVIYNMKTGVFRYDD